MDDMDMELLLLPVLAIEPRAGSSRPEGNDMGGPTATGGARGGGGP
jgi:hypothetical protein